MKFFSTLFHVIGVYYSKLWELFANRGHVVKAIVALPLLFLAIFPPVFIASPFLYVFHPDWGTYSEGYRAGLVHDWGEDRAHWYNPIVTYEGALFLGNKSVAWTNPATGKEENPWNFSSTSSVMKQYQTLTLGHQVAIHYHQVWWQWNLWNGNTDYRVIDVARVDPNLAPDSCGRVHDDEKASDRRNAPIAGTFVKVSTKGNTSFTKSYEVVFQKGDSGNGFLPMSISNSDMKVCADLYVRSGVMAIVHFSQSYFRNPTARDTNYDIVGIEKVKN